MKCKWPLGRNRVGRATMRRRVKSGCGEDDDWIHGHSPDSYSTSPGPFGHVQPMICLSCGADGAASPPWVGEQRGLLPIVAAPSLRPFRSMPGPWLRLQRYLFACSICCFFKSSMSETKLSSLLLQSSGFRVHPHSLRTKELGMRSKVNGRRRTRLPLAASAEPPPPFTLTSVPQLILCAS